MNSLISTQDYEIWDPERDDPIYDGSRNDFDGKYPPQTAFDYLYECCLAISDTKSWMRSETRVDRNRAIVVEYKRTHACERCGFKSLNQFSFIFFEMHLTPKNRIRSMIHWAKPSQLGRELSTRGMFCRKCYRLIKREVTDNIAAPPVNPGSTSIQSAYIDKSEGN